MNNTDPYLVAKAQALITVWSEKWASKWNEYRVVSVEHEFSFPMLNPESEAPSRTFCEAGKMDVVVEHIPTRTIKVIEHKTTSDSIAPDSDYWDRLRMDTQCSKYYLAASQMNIGDVSGVIYDVLRKPGQRPSQIPTLDENGMKIVLDGAGHRIMTSTGKKPRETGDSEKGWVVQSRPETPVEYGARVLSVLRADPDDYFAQREVPRLNKDILEYMEDAWNVSQQILYFRRKGLWARNPDACAQMGRCEMFDLCCGRASVDGVRFAKREKIHAELKIEKSGEGDLELLTASRTRAFNKCRRYHQLRYEDGIELVSDEAEALWFGSLVHSGLEAFFQTLQKQQISKNQ